VRRPSRRQRSPCRLPGRLHDGKTALDTFADHESIAWQPKANNAAATWPKHHLRWVDWSLPVSIAGEECAMNRQRPGVGTVRDQRDHRRPDAPCGVSQPGMVAERPGWLQAQAARNEVGLDQRAVRRRCKLPNAERGLHSHGVTIPVLFFGSSIRHTT
jgi:hypothetical protein